ncbi:hypothetical protein BABINDRAFT_161468 [Babjeviella inositovora NRRL Y-12698]|uniref:Phosphoglycerate mutase n=1 Tax=Babjeviella inositovora NRRL Y-12698 TaxID=984486 RepID=A0A1E3QQ48_9ASCO|nr:uncharacterized protein BABINDRAFT_161468 [Babjeviella inositovora NRRL Y-12698]ODQ79768.1 hypothetical protein BABINDRAFT_161468 [Babjeviella inositovora NRRL Y-12698]
MQDVSVLNNHLRPVSSRPSHKLILVRHGESQWNDSNLFCGWCDVPLSHRGEIEAENAGKLILEKTSLHPVSIYTSFLDRSIESAHIIASTLFPDYTTNPARYETKFVSSWKLNERHYGALQGLDKSQVLKEVGPEKYMFWRRSYDGVPPLAESSGSAGAIEARVSDPEILKYSTIATAKYKGVDQDELPRGESLEMVLQTRVRPYFEEVIRPDLLGTKDAECILVVAHGSTIRSLIKYLYNVSNENIQRLNIPTGSPLLIDVDENCVPVNEYTYLDPSGAKAGAEKVKNQGFH